MAVPRFSPGAEYPAKRRKTMGLNSRFDRMIENVKMSSRSFESDPIAHSRRRGPRPRSTTSSSLTSSDVPKTPVDAYSGLEEGRLGKTFSVLKMKSGRRSHGASDRHDRSGDVRADNSAQVTIFVLLHFHHDESHIDTQGTATRLAF